MSDRQLLKAQLAKRKAEPIQKEAKKSKPDPTPVVPQTIPTDFFEPAKPIVNAHRSTGNVIYKAPIIKDEFEREMELFERTVVAETKAETEITKEDEPEPETKDKLEILDEMMKYDQEYQKAEEEQKAQALTTKLAELKAKRANVMIISPKQKISTKRRVVGRNLDSSDSDMME